MVRRVQFFNARTFDMISPALVVTVIHFEWESICIDTEFSCPPFSLLCWLLQPVCADSPSPLLLLRCDNGIQFLNPFYPFVYFSSIHTLTVCHQRQSGEQREAEERVSGEKGRQSSIPDKNPSRRTPDFARQPPACDAEMPLKENFFSRNQEITSRFTY